MLLGGCLISCDGCWGISGGWQALICQSLWLSLQGGQWLGVTGRP